jgi:hypothetical protein
MDGASTAVRRFCVAPGVAIPGVPTALRGHPALNMARFAAYIAVSINNERR